MIGRQRTGKRDCKPFPALRNGKYRDLCVLSTSDTDDNVCFEVDAPIVLPEKVAVKQRSRIL